MTNLAVIENRISSVKKYLKALKSYRKYSREKIEKDPNLKASLERFLYLATQAAIELAESIVSYRRFRKPTTLKESFDILHEEKAISLELAEKLAKMAGFRNAIAHDYEKFDFGIAYKVLQHDYRDIEEFLKIAEKIK